MLKRRPEDDVKYFYNPDGTFAKPEFIRLTTCTTGFFGGIVKMPIAAGNVFQGVFDMSLATTQPLGATKFGEPYFYVPVRLKGRYRYKAGPVFMRCSSSLSLVRLTILMEQFTLIISSIRTWFLLH